MLMLGCKELNRSVIFPTKHVPHAVLHTFLMVLTSRICLKNSLLLSFFDNPLLYSCDPKVRCSGNTVKRN